MRLFGGFDDDKLKQSFEVCYGSAVQAHAWRFVPQDLFKTPRRNSQSPFPSHPYSHTTQDFVDKVAANWCCRDKPFIAKVLAGIPDRYVSSLLRTDLTRLLG